MSTMTATTVGAGAPSQIKSHVSKTGISKPTLLSRLAELLAEQRKAKAEREARRIRAILEDGRLDPFSEAMLPLSGD